MRARFMAAVVAATGALAAACARTQGSERGLSSMGVSDDRPGSDGGVERNVPLALEPCPLALVEARRGGRDAGRWIAPTEEEKLAIESSVRRLASATVLGWGDAVATSSRELAGAGYEIVEIAELPGTVLLRESPARRRGGGAFLLRPSVFDPRAGQGVDVLVQAPHTFFDVGTLDLACALAGRAHARGLFIDTAHRYLAAPRALDGSFPADVAHEDNSLFQAATAGMVEAHDALRVVQLHGFAPRDNDAAVILSDGGVAASPLVLRVRARLGAVIGAPVLAYPDDTTALGATRNVQGILTRAAGREFLHVELGAELRRELLSSRELRARFLGALALTLEEP
jgi:hypothetical protein